MIVRASKSMTARRRRKNENLLPSVVSVMPALTPITSSVFGQEAFALIAVIIFIVANTDGRDRDRAESDDRKVGGSFAGDTKPVRTELLPSTPIPGFTFSFSAQI